MYNSEMTEYLSGESNPFTRLGPRDFEPPNWEAMPADKIGLLTAEGGPGVVTDPVVQREYASADELIPDYEDGSPGNSGITYYFEDGGEGSISAMVRDMPVYKRFYILYPELADYLRAALSGNRGNAPKALHEDIFKAYRIMRHLVDRSDPYIVRKDGTVDDIFLVR